MKNNKLPIFDHRRIIGFASSAKQAKSIVKSSLSSIPAGFEISVRLRDTSVVDLPEGFVYCVSYKY